MNQQTPLAQQNLLKKDLLFACSLLVVVCIFVTALIVVPFWGAKRDQQRISAEATSTAFAVATQQVNATVTAVAHATEQAQYKFINQFDVNNYMWRQGPEDQEYWSGDIAVEGGVYVWDVQEVKDTFVSWADYSLSESIEDFDVYIDTKVVNGNPGKVCSGLIFRKAPSVSGRDDYYYYFSLCNNSVAYIGYYSDKEGWETINSISAPAMFPYSKDWNRLEVSARGSHFIFLVNGSKIYELDDDRRKAGGIALFIELNEKTPARIVFDNFGFQPR